MATLHKGDNDDDNNNNNNKPDIIICDNNKETCMLVDFAIPGDRNVIKKEVEKILKYKDLITEIHAHVECESKSDTGNKRGDWNHFKITQKIHEQQKRKA